MEQSLNNEVIYVNNVDWSDVNFSDLIDAKIQIDKVSFSLDGSLLSLATASKISFYSKSSGLISELACENAAKGEWITENIWVTKSQECIIGLNASDEDSILNPSNLVDPLLQNYSAESFLVFSRDESGVIFVLDPILLEITRLELDHSQTSPKLKIRWRWAIEGGKHMIKAIPRLCTACSSKLFCISDETGLIAFELKHGNERANVSFQVNVDMTDIDELITDDGKQFQLNQKAKGEMVSLTIIQNKNDTTQPQVRITQQKQDKLIPGLVPIDNSETLFFCCSTKRVVSPSASITDALRNCLSLGLALNLASKNDWNESVVLAVMFEKALGTMDISAAEACLIQLKLTLVANKLPEDIRSKVATSIQNHFRTLAMDEHLSNLVESFFIDCLRQYGDQSCAEALNDWRTRRIAYEEENERSRVDDETILPSNNVSGSLQFTFPSGWKSVTSGNVPKSSGDDPNQSNKDRDLQRVRKAIGTRWNAWTRMTDTQIVFDALERGLLSTCCAFLVARHQHPSQDELKSDSSALQSRFSLDNKSVVINEETVLNFVLSCIQTRALQQLCDYTKTEMSLLRGGMDPLHFYQQVLLHTYNRTLRRNVMYHLMNCEQKNAVLTPEMVEAEKFLSQLEAVLPCKSHAVALRRSWSCLLDNGWTVVSAETRDHSAIEAIRRRWPLTGTLDETTAAWRNDMIHHEKQHSTKMNDNQFLNATNQSVTNNSAQWSEMIKELSVPLTTDSRDGDDERCVETVCATCRAAMEDGTFYLDGHHQDKSNSEEDAFALFLRFSLKSVMSADWETKWRVLKEAGLQSQTDMYSQNELRALVKYLADHNDWRGLKDLLIRSRQATTIKSDIESAVKEYLRFFSPFLRECLKDELFEFDEQHVENQFHKMKKAAIAFLCQGEVKPLCEFIDQFAANGFVDGVHLLLNEEATVNLSSLGKLGALVLAKRYTSQSNHDLPSSTIGADASLLFQAAMLSGAVPMDVFKEEVHPSQNPVLEGVKQELFLLSLLALAPHGHEIFASKDGWIEFAKANSKIFPELFVGLLPESTVKNNNPLPPESLFTEEYENNISAILQTCFGWIMSVDDELEKKTSRDKDDEDEQNKLDTEFFLKQRRPVAAFTAWKRDCGDLAVDTRKSQCIQLARKVVLDRPHDGLILSACCAFLDLCLNEEDAPHRSESSKLRVDGLTLSSILAGTDFAAHEEAEIVELFAHFDDASDVSNGVHGLSMQDDQQPRPNLYALRALQMLLQSSMESDTAEIFPLAFRFCSIHKLPPSLLMLSNLSLQKDLFALLAESDANKIDETVLMDFLKNDRQLKEGERLLALKSLGMDWNRLESLLIDQRQQQTHSSDDILIVDKVLYSSNPSQDLLQLAVQRRESRFAAMATCFEGCDFRLAWIGFLLSSIHSEKLIRNVLKSLVKLDSENSLELQFYLTEMATMAPEKQAWKGHQMDEQDERVLKILVTEFSSPQIVLKRLLRCMHLLIQQFNEFEDARPEIKAALETSAVAFEPNDPCLSRFILFVIGAIDGKLDEIDWEPRDESVMDKEVQSSIVEFQQETLDFVVSHLIHSNEMRIIFLKAIVSFYQNQLSKEAIEKYLCVLSRILFASGAFDREIVDSIVDDNQVDRWLNGFPANDEQDVVLNRLLATDAFELAFEYASLINFDCSPIVVLECQRYLAVLDTIHVEDIEFIINRLKEKNCSDELARDFLLQTMADNSKHECARGRGRWTGSARARLALNLADMFPTRTKVLPDQVLCLRLADEFGCDLSHLVSISNGLMDTNSSKELTTLVHELVHHLRFDDLAVLARTQGGSCLGILRSCARLFTPEEWRIVTPQSIDTMVPDWGLKFREEHDEKDKSFIVAEENEYASNPSLDTLNRLLALHRQFPGLEILKSPNKLNKELIQEILASENGDHLLSFVDLIIARSRYDAEALAELVELFLLASKDLDVWNLVIGTVQKLSKQKDVLVHLLANYREDAAFVLLGRFAANRLATSICEMSRARSNLKQFCAEASSQNLVALLALQNHLVVIDDPECEKTILSRLIEDDAIDLLCDEIGSSRPIDVATQNLVQKYFFQLPLDSVTILHQVKIGKSFRLFENLAIVLEKQGALLAGDGALLASEQCFAESVKLRKRIVNGH